ncbi:preprotein translocase subunit SecE [Gordonia sp. TBRC 11910]|uniref:Protein translocase subunit SecE n=1 Tax=Gordonia asplenii TaxID=2725283 RepID=A0A848LBI4_9ACTN|nr:preprotein translocase subunit SecE [Gordonia asplenii]NMO04948.1 preprotein translocase subunit SecE [Gordonia asplenii]
MIKRDRAARAKDAGEAATADKVDLNKVDELDSVAELDDDADATVRPSGKRKRGSTGTAVADKPSKSKSATPDRPRNPFAAIWLFLQQVVAELKKVIWPTRRDTIVYTIVVLVFVVVVTAAVAGLDIGFARLVLLVFG